MIKIKRKTIDVFFLTQSASTKPEKKRREKKNQTKNQKKKMPINC